ASFGALAKSAYLVPGGHISRTIGNFCRITDRADPWLIYSRMVDNIMDAAIHYTRLYRYGRSELLEQTVIEPTADTEIQRLTAAGNGLIIVVPHCAGAVLSSARLNTICRSVLLVREPRDPARCELMLEYVRKLGPEYILTRNSPPATVMRNIIRALR